MGGHTFAGGGSWDRGEGLRLEFKVVLLRGKGVFVHPDAALADAAAPASAASG
ncbi:MAG: hypothetical protein R6V86_09005 [Spirochaetia bacterium]